MNDIHLTERRRARRFRMAVPVELGQQRGITRDVSECGVLFETDSPIPVGEEVEFVLVLGEYDPAGAYRVRCTGDVVRLDQRGARPRVAVELRSYSV